MEKIGEAAGLTKKSLYYHFPSKEQLVAATAEHMREDYLSKCRDWFSTTSEDESFRERAVIATQEFAEHAKQPSWKGCCFVRITADLANEAGHPAHRIVQGARCEMENWFEGMIAKDGIRDSAMAARQMVIFVNGLVLMMLQDRSGSGVAEAANLLSTILS